MNICYSKDPNGYRYVCDKEDAGYFLKQLVKYGDKSIKKWLTEYQRNLLLFLAEFVLPTAHHDARPYERKIEIYVKDPDGPGGGGPYRVISYEEGESFEVIAKRYANVVIDFWNAEIENPLKTAREVGDACRKYTKKKIKL